jgi:hypothetical protein
MKREQDSQGGEEERLDPDAREEQSGDRGPGMDEGNRQSGDQGE